MPTEQSVVGRRGHHRRPTRRLWSLCAAIALVAACVLAGPVLALGGSRPMSFTAVALLALAFACAEMVVVHIRLRGEAHTLTFTEVPVVVGLLLVHPVGLVLAQLVGGAVARAIRRRQSAVKHAFNLSLGVLDAGIAVVVFSILAGGLPDALGLRTQVAVVATTLLVTVVSDVLVAAAIALAGGPSPSVTLATTIGPSVMVSATNATLALSAVTLLQANPVAVWLLLAPALTLFAAYRAYVSERHERERVNFLYACSRDLHEGSDAGQAVTSLLRRALDTFRASRAELLLLPADDATPPVRTVVGSTGTLEVMAPLDADQAVLPLTARATDDLMAAPVTGQKREVGLLTVSQPLSEVGAFGPEDVRLLNALAAQVGLFLETDRLGQAIEHLNQLQGRLLHQAYHDPLTALANRRMFRERLEQALAAGREVLVLFIDLDDFKTINDSLGHAAGDCLLSAVAGRLTRSLRPEDLAARLGGDEFAVLVEGDASADDGLGHRILSALSDPFAIGHNQVLVRASVGVAKGSADLDTADLLLSHADLAMYASKEAGKGRVRAYDPSLSSDLQQRLELEMDLERALATGGQLGVAYQPVVDLASGHIVSLEVLARWTHPVRGVVAPKLFIRAAERSGLVLTLGRSVLASACSQLQRWQERGVGCVALAFNASVQELQDRGYVDHLLATLADHGVDPHSITIEVTESMLMHDNDRAVLELHRLRANGVRVAVDDFGTGYSSISRLRSLPVDILKIDRTFVHALGQGEAHRAYARSIVALAESVGLVVVGEGVESGVQAQELAALGCHLAQGRHFAAPIEDPDAVLGLLRATGQDASASASEGGRSSVAMLASMPFTNRPESSVE